MSLLKLAECTNPDEVKTLYRDMVGDMRGLESRMAEHRAALCQCGDQLEDLMSGHSKSTLRRRFQLRLEAITEDEAEHDLEN